MSSTDGTPGTDPSRRTDVDTVVPVVAEELTVDVEAHTTGRARVTTRTESVERTIEKTLSSLTAEITRVPVERELGSDEAIPQTRVEGNVTVVPLLEERLVIEKRLVLVEEIRIERVSGAETVKVPVTLRRQRVDVERLPDDMPDTQDSDPSATPQRNETT